MHMRQLHTFGANSHLVLSVVLEETLDSTAGKLGESVRFCARSYFHLFLFCDSNNIGQSVMRFEENARHHSL